MTPSASLRRLTLRRILLASATVIAIVAPVAFSADPAPTATLTLRPHCSEGTTPCPTFTVVDPETMRTPPLANNATLDMDLVANNPNQRKISRVRTWLQYNSAVLEGTTIDAGSGLPTATPGEKDFSATDGLIKIEVSATAGQEPTTQEVVVARIQLRVKTIPQTNTDVLSFYDVQASGHTRILAAREAGEPEDILTQTPGSLLIAFQASAGASSSATSAASGSGTSTSSVSSGSGQAVSSANDDGTAGSGSSSVQQSSAASGASSVSTGPICGNGLLETGEECDDGNFLAGDGCAVNCRREVIASSSASSSATSLTGSGNLLPDGSTCGSHTVCLSGLCSGGVCRGDVLKVEDGGACNAATQCIGGSCVNNRCGISASSSSHSSSVSLPAGKTAFTLLQVRNVRITTEGTSLYVAWDPLISSQLKAYNLYYGSTTGRYLQRKTISAESTSMAIRGLPEKTTYFVAIRGLSLTDEETAFSQEVSVEVGNPKTSTAPLTGDLLATRKPVTVPGETGTPSVIVLLLTLSAVIGTAFATRRQTLAITSPAHSR